MERNRVYILGCGIDIVDSRLALKKAEELILRGIPSQVITLNAEIAYAASLDDRLRQVINEADLVTPDGIGIVWAARHKGYDIKERVTGIDMVYNLCQLAANKGYRVFLLGASPGVAEKAACELKKMYPYLIICGTRDGYFREEEKEEVIKSIREARPHILLVALGAPKQEFFISRHKEELGVPLCLGVGGSFDVIAGVKKRAPGFMIRLNLEWLYRLLSEPSRFKRQMALPKFVLKVLREK
ncbi:N-acetylmannosaminyltransferase [Thermosyntropha lipolytica DSM 11003]|uniref:N-acetylglucosaminyldiphosphoundecaprenol N-acetyl-beta-D-mannosaminyltransferase n=1 Tax=Thermosyntropha lipolytica DSM 11003 TaxID=1123382 RepID=A0A1M5NSP5_9FIRM|nr:WecB/TagA/CpsF family glycosyltransferase [Thermosyntropha lipolytica]SHG92552.1 N-acetylmannosaminyltransferase [Thermosyntropha lipolytica DSM 11003]